MGEFHSAYGDGLKKHFILRHGHPLLSAYLVFSARYVPIYGTYRAENTYLVGHGAAINRERCSGDASSNVACQEHCNFCNFFNFIRALNC